MNQPKTKNIFILSAVFILVVIIVIYGYYKSKTPEGTIVLPDQNQAATTTAPTAALDVSSTKKAVKPTASSTGKPTKPAAVILVPLTANSAYDLTKAPWIKYDNGIFTMQYPGSWQAISPYIPTKTNFAFTFHNGKYGNSYDEPGLVIHTEATGEAADYTIKESKVFSQSDIQDYAIRDYFFTNGMKIYATCIVLNDFDVIPICNKMLSSFSLE